MPTARARPGARRPRPTRRLPPEVLTAAEVLALLDACGDWPTGVRNRALLAVLYRGGLRLNEALELRPKDVDRDSGAVRVLCGKGGRARTIGLDDGALALLDRWLAVRASWASGRQRRRPPCSATGSAASCGGSTSGGRCRSSARRRDHQTGPRPRPAAHARRGAAGRGRGHWDHLQAARAHVDRDDRPLPGPHRHGGGGGGDAGEGVGLLIATGYWSRTRLEASEPSHPVKRSFARYLGPG